MSSILRTSCTAVIALAFASVPLSAQEAAQTVAEAASELPAVVVEGATIEARPVTKPKPKASVPTAGDIDVPVAPGKPKRATKPAAASSDTTSGDAPAASQPQTAPLESAETDGLAVSDTGEGIPVQKIGSAVSVVTGAQLRAQHVRNAAEALRSLPGVAVSRTGGVGGFTQVRLRGAEANHTAVMIDGIEANDTTIGEFNFADLLAEDIERIEVIRGPQSGLYGSGAIGGAINIVTRSGRGPLTLRAAGDAGSFTTRGGTLGVSGGTDKVWGLVSVSEQKTSGFNIAPFGGEEDGSQLRTINLRGGVQIVPGITLDLTLRHTARDGERDDQIFDPVTFASDGLQHDTASRFDEKTTLAGAKLTWESLDGHLVQVAKVNRNETARKDFSYDGTTGDNLGVRDAMSYAATYQIEMTGPIVARHFFTGMLEHEIDRFTPKSDFGFFGKADGLERSRELDAGAFQYRGEFADRLFVQGTLRRDDSSEFGGFTTWRTSASLLLPEAGLRPHASYGTGLKLPTMFENFGSIPGRFYPNPSLGPERSKGWDGGVEMTLLPGIATLDVTYFQSRLSDKIRSFVNCLPPDFLTCSVENDPGVAKSQGIEVTGRVVFGWGVSLGLAYTYTDARSAKGEQEIRRPRHAGRGDLTYVFDSGRGTLSASAEYVAENRDTDFGSFTTVTLDPYWLVNVAASYNIHPGVEIFGRVENLLDQNYQEIFGFNTAGIAAYAGVRINLEDPSTLDWVRYK